MTCKAFQIMIEKYREGILERHEEEPLRQHIKTCSVCRAAYEEFAMMQTFVQDSISPSDAGKEKVTHTVANVTIEPAGQSPLYLSRASWRGYAAAAAVFFVIGLFIGLRQSNPAVTKPAALSVCVSQLEGEVLIRHEWEDGWKPITKEEPVYKGDSFIALHQARLVLALDEQNTVTMDENSSLDLLEYNGLAEFGIEYGTVKATLNGPHEPFFVSTPQGRFEALGTEFIVHVR